MFLRLVDNIIVNSDTIVMAERTKATVKITCTNNDVVTVMCDDTKEAMRAMDRIMEEVLK